MKKQAITSITAYYINQNWALQAVQLAFTVIDSLVIPFLTFNPVWLVRNQFT
jgi:hypothetical protein